MCTYVYRYIIVFAFVCVYVLIFLKHKLNAILESKLYVLFWIKTTTFQKQTYPREKKVLIAMVTTNTHLSQQI